MLSVLICTLKDLEPDLGRTLLWREDVRRQFAGELDQAMTMALAGQPNLVVVDRDVPWAGRLVTGLREHASTRSLSMVVVARGYVDPSEAALLEAGANAILRLPAGPGWNDRLQRLIDIPIRKEARFPVSFKVLAAPWAKDEDFAVAVNLSVRGVLIEASGSLNVWDEVDLQLRLPSGETVRVHGRVVRLAGPGHFGVELISYDADGQDSIRRFLDTLDAP